MTLASIVLGVVMAAAGAGAAAGQATGAQPDTTVNVAVVSVPKVSEGYLRTLELEAHFEQLRLRFNEERNALRAKLERGAIALREEFKPGTSEFEQRRKELALLQAELQYFEETQGRKLEGSLARSLRQIFQDIQQMVGQIAEEKGYDVVLAYDQLPPESPDTTALARQQIVLQKVIYWNPRVDLTQEVITRLNAKYERERPRDPTG